MLFQGGTNPEGRNLAEHCLPHLQRGRGLHRLASCPPVPSRSARGGCRLRVLGPHSEFRALQFSAKASPGHTPQHPPPTSSSSCLKGCSLAGWGAHPIPELCAPLAPRSPVYAAGEGTVRCASSPAGLELAFHVQCGSP